MLNVNIICHGTLKEKYLRDAVAEYSKRLGAYCKLNILEAKDDEGLEALVAARSKDYNIALCIEGKMVDSEEFAQIIDDVPLSGYSGMGLVIGGSDGLPEKIKAMCKQRLSFSKMTFPHQLMRVILLEQIYRGFNINNGGKYHK